MTRPLIIAWLYGAKMNIYGDRGNIIALQQRAAWRGIDARVETVEIGQPIPPVVDIVFWGGGQDQDQVACANDIQGPKGADLLAAVNDGAALLAICGGYQLLGHEYRPHNADPLPGLGLFDLTSVAGPERFIGNVVVETSIVGQLIGFENHSGLTWLGPDARPLGKALVGRGNNGQDGTEGCIAGTAIGCYLHGALLPKNPRLTDWLLAAGLEHRDGTANLAPLDDALEQLAHDNAIMRAKNAR